MSIGVSSAPHFGRAATRVQGVRARLRAFLCSPEMLILAYVLSVLLEFKPPLYLFFGLSIININWKVSPARVLAWLSLAVAMGFFFTTVKNINASLVFLIVALGFFSSKEKDKFVFVERIAVAFSVLGIFAIGLLYTAVFDPNEGVVSQNFIPIVGLYVLLAALKYPASLKLVLALGFAFLSFYGGSRSGTLIFLLLSSYLISPRLVWLLLGAICLDYFFTPVTSISLPQFDRNYEASGDPRLFIWAEFLDKAFTGGLFRLEDFDFMEVWSLERNFHNSFLEAYYRLGWLSFILFFFHISLIFKSRRVHPHLPVILMLLSMKAFFDTFLFFTPLDVLVFKLYGEEIFGFRPFVMRRWRTQTTLVQGRENDNLH